VACYETIDLEQKILALNIGVTTLSLTTLSITPLSFKLVLLILPNGTQHNNKKSTPSITTQEAE